MKGVSLFSSAGIAEMYLKELGIDMVVASELVPKRAQLILSVKWLLAILKIVQILMKFIVRLKK